jgi:hypothetical protein
MTTIEELAQAVLEVTSEDQQELQESADIETAAFQEYLSEYMLGSKMVCKGCHGG